ncbi:MAG: hypothetical protein ACLPTF_08380 [Steroidobacteraceae bacterium]
MQPEPVSPSPLVTLGAMIEAHWSEVRAIYQAAIFPENGVSQALRRALGYELVGLRRHLGKMSYGLFSGQ